VKSFNVSLRDVGPKTLNTKYLFERKMIVVVVIIVVVVVAIFIIVIFAVVALNVRIINI
jgi:hypothetical protein